MTFKEVLEQVVKWLQQDGRVSYRALQRQYELDDDYLADLKEAISFSHPQVCDEAGRGLVWTGALTAPTQNPPAETDSESRFHAALPAVIALLQREGRLTYRTLKYACGLSDKLLSDICTELTFRELAVDQQNQGLVWTGAIELRAPTAEGIPSQPASTHTTDVTSANLSLSLPSTESSMPSDGSPSLIKPRFTDSSNADPVVIREPIRSVPEAEHRQLTVMFCDLVGSTDLSGKLDPEHLREVVQAYQETAAEVIGHYEGHIAQYLGDGLLIYFGYPVAHEDDAQRAVYTGLGIPEAMANLNRRLTADYGVELAVRIGIHTGPVVVGEMGGGNRHENLALGETPNIAARLEGLAPSNTAVISSATAQLVQRSMVLEELGEYELKGVAAPLPLYRVVGSREPEYDDYEAMLAGGFDALVGRDEEIGLLLRRWQQSKDGAGQVVLISGDAGLGKSSLVEGLRVHVHQEGYTRIAFRCSPYTTNSALHPVIEQVRRVLGWQRADSTAVKLDKLEQALQPTSLPLEEAVPLLAALLSLPLPEDRYPVLTLTPHRQRQLTQDALVAWMLEEAERRPVLAVWEDLHWADPSTLELLGLFIEQTPTVPMLNVLAFRPEFVPPWTPQSHTTPITLNRLERTHIEALVKRLAGGKQLPREVVEHIVDKTDGVPLYVQELTKMLLESDLLTEENEQYTLIGSLSSASIPATLQDSLMARLDSLPTVKDVAQLGSVLGREFDYDVLRAISLQDDDTLQTSLSQLVTAELLYQRGRPPKAKYIFKHALIQDTAYTSLLRSTRQQYHQQIAQLLEARFPDVVRTQPELVAHHYTAAGDHEPSIQYWQRAGAWAIHRGAHAETVEHLSQGLSLLTALPETPEHLQLELDLLLALGPALRATKGGGSPDMERVYVRARELCQQIGDTPNLFPVLRGLGVYYMGSGQIQSAHQIAEQLLHLAQSQSDPVFLSDAHHMLGQTSFYRGDLPTAHRYHLKALSYNPHQGQFQDKHLPYNATVAMYSWLAWELCYLGYPDQALDYSQAARKLAHEELHPNRHDHMLVWATFLSQLRREVEVTRKHAEAAVTHATLQGNALRLAQGTVLHGWARVAQGQHKAGIDDIQAGLAAELGTGSKGYRHHFLGLLAEAYGQDGRPEEGLGVLAEALALIDATDVRYYEAELHRLKGELQLQLSSNHQTEAEACFEQALVIARRQQAKFLELRAATNLARLWRSQGQHRQAYELLVSVYDWFTEGFDTADLVEAKALLVELEEGG